MTLLLLKLFKKFMLQTTDLTMENDNGYMG